MKLSLRHVLFLFLACALAACAQIGMRAGNFGDKLAAGYVAVQVIDDGAVTLLQAGKMTKDEAIKLKATNAAALAALDAAAAMAGADPSGADTRLTATIAILSALQAQLAAKQGAPK